MRIRRLVVTATTLGVLVAAFAIGRATAPITVSRGLLDYVDDTRSDVQPEDSEPAQLAVEIALGQIREDGRTFGEFSRIRTMRICKINGPDRIRIEAYPNGATSNRTLWSIQLTAAGDCPTLQHNIVHLANVWSDTGAVISAGEDSREFNPAGLVVDAPPVDGWYSDFRAGDEP